MPLSRNGLLPRSSAASASAHPPASAGFTLLEVMIAMVVLSIGLLGVAALHAESLRSGNSAMLRTKAVTLAADMADRMRANRVAALAGDYVIGDADTGANGDCADDLEGGPTVPCTPQQMASHDVWLWKRLLVDPRTGLPGPATGHIVSDGAALPTFTITVNWVEAGAARDFALSVQL